VHNALGEHVYSKFMEAKKRELDSYRAQVHPWELETYLAKY